jgi:hypothetical protein
MKTCFKCLKRKSSSDFYAHPQMFDGHLSKCKDCTRSDNRKNRESRVGYYRAYDRWRHSQTNPRPLSPRIGPSLPRGRYTYADIIYRTWKGTKSDYRALHRWVESRLGKPHRCAACKRDGLSGRQIHWANKSGKYHKNIRDWIRLCASCHVRKDSAMLRTLVPLKTNDITPNV